MLLIKVVDQGRPVLWDMGIAEGFVDHRSVFTFDQGIIIGLSSARFGEFNQQLLQEFNNVLINVFRAVVGVKAADHKGERFKQIVQGGDQIALTDFFEGEHELELGDFIDGVDVINAFLLI